MSYLRDRIIQALVSMWGIVTISFFLIRLMPGGPIVALELDIYANPHQYGLPPEPSEEEVNRVLENYANIPPDQSIWEAYLDYLISVFVHGDLGESITFAPGVEVSRLILEHAPWTIFLSTVALIYGMIVGIILGVFMAYYEGTKFDIGMTVSMILSSGIPYYVAAIFLLYIFGFQLEWFPSGGRVNPDYEPGMNWAWVSSVFYHAVLPVFSFIITGFGAGALAMRANSIRLLGEEYIEEAHLRGLSTYRISVTYLGRNAILPIWTSIITGLGGLLGGSVILEFIFQYPGMGHLMFRAAILQDYPVLMGALIVTTFLFIIGTLIADFTYPLIDPRADMKVSRE